MEMKKMEYNGSGISEVLYYEKSDDGYGLAVVNTRGSHPCAYVTFPGIEDLESDCDIYLEDDEDYYIVHGGFTFLGTLSNLGLEGTWLGWDYAHLEDWIQSLPPEKDPFPHRGEHKYDTLEVYSDAKVALDYIRKGNYKILS